MLASCKSATIPFALSVLLPSEISVLQQAAETALKTTGSPATRVKEVWKQHEAYYWEGEIPANHKDLLTMFSETPMPVLKHPLYKMRTQIEALMFLLQAYNVASINSGIELPVYWAAQFAINRLLVSFRESDNNYGPVGIVPWMNAGINFLIDENIDIECLPVNPEDKQSAITEVFLRSSCATAYVSQLAWQGYLKWRLGPTSTMATEFNEILCSEEDSAETNYKPISLLSANLLYCTQAGLDISYRLTARLDDSFSELIRLDLFMSNIYSHPLSDARPLIMPIALERSAAFLFGVKWWLKSKPNVKSYLKLQTERWQRERGFAAWVSKALF